MKIKSLAMIGALACGSGSPALAQPQYIYITGSTAMRSIVYHAFADGAGVFDATPNFVGYGSSTASSCSFMNFSNTLGGSTPTIVKCHWSGSEAGITDVSGSTQESFLNAPGVGGVAATGPNGATPTGSQLITNGVDLAMADNNLSFSKTPG